ncbi:MAG TPA: adenylate/guanylate cyclase domain-containing protein [Nitrososphaerales archaeon]|nr:adenylate/guanylate cyclase domain-containing protein [Nitrososphaerales archaeon]
MTEGERRLAAIMFTDIVGYTSFTQRDEALAMELLEEHRALVRPFFPKHKGREVKTVGDAFLVEFGSALEAVRCAYDIQRSLHDLSNSRTADRKVEARVGIHLGDVIHSQSDVYGDAVNVASRIEPIATPGGICISEQVYDQVRNKLEFPMESLGKRELKNVAEPVEVYKLVMPWEERRTASPEDLDTRRVAVMPLTNMIRDPEDEYFADGMTEELISAISKVPELSVISRTSVMLYKNQATKAMDIGRALNAGTLLEGSVRKAGNRVRIAVQLIDVGSDRHLWAENFDRRLEDVFAVQSEIAEKVADSLRVKLTDVDRKRIEKGGTQSAEAHTLYLKGQFSLNRWDEPSLRTAIKYFEGASALDPDYTLAYCGLAGAHARLGFFGMMDSDEASRKSESFARKALELDESLAEAHAMLALSLSHSYDFAGQERELKRAIELNPNLAGPHEILAGNYGFRNRWEECLAEIRKALDLDPLSVAMKSSAGSWCLYARRYDEAIGHLRDVLELDPNNSFAMDNLGLALVQKGMIDEGLAEILRACETWGNFNSYGDLGYAYVKAGKPEEARKLLEKMNERAEGKPVPYTAVAGVHAALGNKEEAMEWLERAYNEHSGYIFAIKGDFVFESLHSEPRFQALLSKMGLD